MLRFSRFSSLSDNEMMDEETICGSREAAFVEAQ